MFFIATPSARTADNAFYPLAASVANRVVHSLSEFVHCGANRKSSAVGLNINRPDLSYYSGPAITVFILEAFRERLCLWRYGMEEQTEKTGKTEKKSRLGRRIIGITLGALAGFAYYYFIGCESGTCPITSNPYITTLYGAAFGAVLSY